MSRFLKHCKVFDDSKGRFFLALITEASDARLSTLSLSITDGNSIWKAATSFEESCGSLNSRREENIKHLIKRISNCRLEFVDAEELTVTLVPPGKTCELKFKKSADVSGALQRLDLLVTVAEAGDLKTLVDTVDEDTTYVSPSKKPKSRKKEAVPVEKEGMSLLNPRSRKITMSKGVDFD